MILIKTKDDLYNLNNVFRICHDDFLCNGTETYLIRIMDSNFSYYIYKSENKEMRDKVYNEIQKQIIDLNTKEVGDYIDVDAIVKEVEENYTNIDNRIFYS